MSDNVERAVAYACDPTMPKGSVVRAYCRVAVEEYRRLTEPEKPCEGCGSPPGELHGMCCPKVSVYGQSNEPAPAEPKLCSCINGVWPHDGGACALCGGAQPKRYAPAVPEEPDERISRLTALLREAREALADHHFIGTLTTRIDKEVPRDDS